ncbi:MAG: rhodanese-like domain-containing protein [Bacteroidia bacterium]
MKNLLALLLLLITINSCGQMKVESPAFEKAIKTIIPTHTKLISTHQLADSFDLSQTVLLDAREKNEYEISHLPNAIWIGYDDFDINRVKSISKSSQVVVYCSVGYRSGVIGQKIQKAGYKNVYNLYGGIFEWVNQGYSVVNVKGPVNKVHGYDAKWSIFVKGAETILNE